MQLAEVDPTRNSTGRNAIALAVNTETSVITATVTLPITYAVGAAGITTLTATAYLT